MSPTQPVASEPAPTTPFRATFTALIGFGQRMLACVQAALAHQPIAHLPRRFARAPATAAQRLARTLDWITALARTLAGDTTWLIPVTYVFPRFPGRYPALTAQLRAECGLPPVPPRTEAQKAAAHRRYVRRVFATQPVARIAARLARRLGIAQTDAAWPTDLLAIPQSPVVWAKRARATAPNPPTQPPPAPPSPTAAPPPPQSTGPP